MNEHQELFLSLLKADVRRDIYEGGDSLGRYWVTYTGGVAYRPLTTPEVKEMLAAGLISQVWPGCYTTPRNMRHHQEKWAALEETRRVRKQRLEARKAQRQKAA